MDTGDLSLITTGLSIGLFFFFSFFKQNSPPPQRIHTFNQTFYVKFTEPVSHTILYGSVLPNDRKKIQPVKDEPYASGQSSL